MNETHVSDILRFYGMYRRYEIGRAFISAELAMLRGRRVDLAAEYMALGASLQRAHCAAHLKEKATRERNAPLTPFGEEMLREADEIAFRNDLILGASAGRWIEANANCVCIPYLQAAAKFLSEHPLKLVEAQFRVVNRMLRYVGHPDFLVQWPSGKYCLLSIKSGDLPNFAGVQEALYLLADPEDFAWPAARYNIQRAVVQFRNDAGYAFCMLNDFADFQAAEHFAIAYAHAVRINGEME